MLALENQTNVEAAFAALTLQAILARGTVLSTVLDLLPLATEPAERRRLATILLRATSSPILAGRAASPKLPAPPRPEPTLHITESPDAAPNPTPDATAAPIPDLPTPSPELSPQAVARTVLDAFRSATQQTGGRHLATLALFLADGATINAQPMPSLPADNDFSTLTAQQLDDAMQAIQSAASPLLDDLPLATSLAPHAQPFLSPARATINYRALLPHLTTPRRITINLTRSDTSRIPGCWLIAAINSGPNHAHAPPPPRPPPTHHNNSS